MHYFLFYIQNTHVELNSVFFNRVPGVQYVFSLGLPSESDAKHVPDGENRLLK